MKRIIFYLFRLVNLG